LWKNNNQLFYAFCYIWATTGLTVANYTTRMMRNPWTLSPKAVTAALCAAFIIHTASATEVVVTGTVSDDKGSMVMIARVSFYLNAIEYRTITRSDGSYSVRISGSYSEVDGEFRTGTPYPNPFDNSVHLPFVINSQGDLLLTIYNMSGQKVRVVSFPGVSPGSYNIVWDGCSQDNAPLSSGLYIYALTFRGRTRSGRLIKAGGSVASGGTYLEPVMMPPETPSPDGSDRFPVIAEVEAGGYYPVRLTDITLARDTVINFVLSPAHSMPFTVSGDHIARQIDDKYKSMILKGVNLGSSPPGFFPGEIAYAITAEMYQSWIERMVEAGFNTLRVYTLHPPVFYEKLAEYNQRHPESPLLLFQGIWLEEIEDGTDPSCYDLLNRAVSFRKEIEEAVDCINGNADIPFRYGKAYGVYRTNVSRWTAGYIIGREVAPQEVDTTNKYHQGVTTYSGTHLSISGGTATEVFVAEMLDEVVTVEESKYSVTRPVSFSSWPTLDPPEHPTEIYTDEDVASFDITKIRVAEGSPGLFASYHAYPYYPNFVSQEPSYMLYSDSEGPNSYLGYLTALKDHYSGTAAGDSGVRRTFKLGAAHISRSVRCTMAATRKNSREKRTCA